jgi:hypothetical protein
MYRHQSRQNRPGQIHLVSLHRPMRYRSGATSAIISRTFGTNLAKAQQPPRLPVQLQDSTRHPTTCTLPPILRHQAMLLRRSHYRTRLKRSRLDPLPSPCASHQVSMACILKTRPTTCPLLRTAPLPNPTLVPSTAMPRMAILG